LFSKDFHERLESVIHVAERIDFVLAEFIFEGFVEGVEEIGNVFEVRHVFEVKALVDTEDSLAEVVFGVFEFEVSFFGDGEEGFEELGEGDGFAVLEALHEASDFVGVDDVAVHGFGVW